MDTLHGDMNTIQTALTHPSRSRKRKPSPPPKYRSNDHRSSSPVDAYDGAYSDSFHDDAGPSGNEFMNPRKKARTDPAIKPALDGLTNLGVRSGGPEDAGTEDWDFDFGDASLDKLDPSAFDQLDEMEPPQANPKVDDDAGPSGDEFTSPRKKARTDPAIKPALDGLTKLGVRSGGPEDTGTEDWDFDFGDASLDKLDPSAFDQLDEMGPPQTNPKVEPAEVDLKMPLRPMPAPARAEQNKTENLGWMSYYDSLSVTKDQALGSGPSAFSSMTQDRISALEPDGSLRFFWFDYFEHDGKVHFIGKLKDKNSGMWISCCVTVENLQRNLYVLPRKRRIEFDEDGDEYETDFVPQITDVYQEFDTYRKRSGVKSWKAKFVKRKYAFGERDVPRGEAQWMKVVYGFDGMSFTPVINMWYRRGPHRTRNRLREFRQDLRSCFRNEHERIRTPRCEEEDQGPLLVAD
jgi:hypothetical protein